MDVLVVYGDVLAFLGLLDQYLVVFGLFWVSGWGYRMVVRWWGARGLGRRRRLSLQRGSER